MSGRIRSASGATILLSVALAACVAAAFTAPPPASRPALSTTSAPALDAATRERQLTAILQKAETTVQHVPDPDDCFRLHEELGQVYVQMEDTAPALAALKRAKDLVPRLDAQ